MESSFLPVPTERGERERRGEERGRGERERRQEEEEEHNKRKRTIGYLSKKGSMASFPSLSLITSGV